MIDRKIDTIRVMHVIASPANQGGEMRPVVWELARHQAQWGAAPQVVDLRGTFEPASSSTQGVPFESARLIGPAALGFSLDLRRRFRAAAGEIDLVHVHGLWTYPGFRAGQLARHGLPCVISPHGMLEPWALQQSPLMNLGALDRHNLRSASCIHALCEPEVRRIRAFGLANPIAVIPSGVDLAAYDHLPDRDAIARRFPSLGGRRRALFLSRIRSAKGLPHLLTAWAGLRPFTDGWVLIVAGPDQLAHETELKALAAALHVDNVLFAGALTGEARREALAGADLFVLPSFCEACGAAVLEAAACRLPVLMTPGCNISELTATGAAIEVEPNVEDTWRGLRRVLGFTDAQRQAMGARGRAWVESRCTWNIVSAAMVGVYVWLLGGGPPPECVRIA